MNPGRKSWWLGLGLILGFWFVVILHDYPAPFVDDLYYIGAGINLAQHGVLYNPFCENLNRIDYPGHFFVYMPFQSYVLAGWLRLTGISTASFHILYTWLSLSVSLLIFRFFPAGKLSWLYALLICAMTFGLLGGAGLRPDALGLFFFLLGLDAYRAYGSGVFFLKNFCLGLAVITFPNVAILSLVVSVSSLIYLRFIENRPARSLVPQALAMSVAYALCFLIFMTCIGGLLPEFLKAMSRGEHMGSDGVFHRFVLFSGLGVTKWLVSQTGFLVLVLALIYRWRGNPRRCGKVFFLVLSLAGFFILGFTSAASATGAHVWAFGCLVVSLLLIAEEGGKPGYLGVWLIFFCLAALGHGHVVIEDFLADKPPGPEKRAALLAEIDRLHPVRLYVDAYAMRELYDYRLPANAFCYETSNTGGWGKPQGISSLPANSVSIVSVENIISTPRNPKAKDLWQPLNLFNHKIPFNCKNPYDLVIIDNRN